MDEGWMESGWMKRGWFEDVLPNGITPPLLR